MGPAIGRLIQSHAGLNVLVTVAPFAELPGLLRERRIDFFVGDYTLLSGTSDMEIQPLAPQEIVFFCRKGHPLAEREEINVDEFFSYPHVGPPLPQWAEEWLRNHRPKGFAAEFLRLECSHHGLLKNVVANSDTISGAPFEVIRAELDPGRFSIVRLAVKPMYSRAGVVWLVDRPPTTAGKLLIDELCVGAGRSTTAGTRPGCGRTFFSGKRDGRRMKFESRGVRGGGNPQGRIGAIPHCFSNSSVHAWLSSFR